jgi:hypothetical protein
LKGVPKRARDWRTLSTTPGLSGKAARPVPDRTRDTGSGWQAFSDIRERGVSAYLSTNAGFKIVDNLKADSGEAREDRRHHALFFLTISDKASAVPGFISGHGEADIHARAPDDLGEHENPQRDVEHQEREQAYRHDTNHAAAVLPAYRFAAVDGDAGKAENVSEAG